MREFDKSNIKDLKRKADSLSRDTLGLEGRPPPHENCLR